MTLRLEENELLAALLTAQEMADVPHRTDRWNPSAWREFYQRRLREFIELNKAEIPHARSLSTGEEK